MVQSLARYDLVQGSSLLKPVWLRMREPDVTLN